MRSVGEDPADFAVLVVEDDDEAPAHGLAGEFIDDLAAEDLGAGIRRQESQADGEGPGQRRTSEAEAVKHH